ncbi:solute carrier organic anion transporter family member 2A1-like isoform X1 [Octopus sinensis]|uniref:Solute carrier organic anion transporter family member n=2 Tax=Octopus sinensis TaxID=2607531 RepID=A0A7E6EPK5_9MOLL|nr:solute carrier organic anion transporter family member 2A1-like isoform X1 [Octopus sinensis]
MEREMSAKSGSYTLPNEDGKTMREWPQTSKTQLLSTDFNPAENGNDKYVNKGFEEDPPPLNCDVNNSINTSDRSCSNVDDFVAECGISSCKPQILQICANLSCFTATYSFAALLTQTLSVYLTTQITSIEKQFGFNSSQIGIILSGNDIGFLTTVLFVSHFARRTHIPRFLGASTFLFGLSGLVCCFIYFVNHEPRLVSEGMDGLSNHTTNINDIAMCNSTTDANDISSNCLSKNANKYASQTQKAFILFMVGMMIQGVAKSPRTSLITAFVDNNVKDKSKTALFMGIIVTMGIFGPSLAFLLGGVFSRLPVDLKDIGLTPKDPRWIGAWWLGFVVFGIGSLLFSIPIFFFPRNFRKQTIEYHDDKGLMCKVKAFPKSLCRLIRSPVYVLSLLAVCVLLFGISGSLTFTPKYIEHQFTTPAWKTNVILGIEKVLGASTGTLLGGIFTSKMKLSRQGCLKLKIVITFLSAGMEGLSFIFGCPRIKINNIPASNQHFIFPNATAKELCGMSCNCTEEYFPICGSDGENYFSPCTAGCSAVNNSIYSSCECIGHNGTALSGLCDTDCPYLYPYVGVDLLKSFTGTFSIVPGYLILLRSVLEEDKAIAIGLMSFATSFIGWMSGPIAFGLLLDLACTHWAETCGVRSECQLYDIEDMRLKIHGTLLSVRVLCGIILVVALIVAFFEEKSGKTWDTKESHHSETEPKLSPNTASSNTERNFLSVEGRLCQVPSVDVSQITDNSSENEETEKNINCRPSDVYQPKSTHF